MEAIVITSYHFSSICNTLSDILNMLTLLINDSANFNCKHHGVISL